MSSKGILSGFALQEEKVDFYFGHSTSGMRHTLPHSPKENLIFGLIS